MVALTSQGVTTLEKWEQAHHHQWLGAALSGLDPADRAAARAALPALARLIEHLAQPADAPVG